MSTLNTKVLLPAETHINIDVNVFVKIATNDLEYLAFLRCFEKFSGEEIIQKSIFECGYS